jgi:hypothetical protein
VVADISLEGYASVVYQDKDAAVLPDGETLRLGCVQCDALVACGSVPTPHPSDWQLWLDIDHRRTGSLGERTFETMECYFVLPPTTAETATHGFGSCIPRNNTCCPEGFNLALALVLTFKTDADVGDVQTAIQLVPDKFRRAVGADTFAMTAHIDRTDTADISEALRKTRGERSFLRTSGGFLGQGPPGAAVGDIVCLVLGYGNPFLIRRRDSHYQLVVGVLHSRHDRCLGRVKWRKGGAGVPLLSKRNYPFSFTIVCGVGARNNRVVIRRTSYYCHSSLPP